MFANFHLDHRLNKAINELGYSQATPVQEATIPLAMQKKDLKVSAETGSGKTAAFLLPVMHQLLEKNAPQSGTRALVLVPTRELARQVYKTFQQLSKFHHLKAAIVIGGEEFKYQKALLRKNPELLIATPGRLIEHLDKGNLDLKDLEALILDEADRMLDMGFSEDVLKIAELSNKTRQTLLFSATLKLGKMRQFTEMLFTGIEAETIILNSARDNHADITQQLIFTDDKKHKEQLVDNLLHNETFRKCLIFTNTKIQANQLGAYLRYKKHNVSVLHGDMNQQERNDVINQLRGNHTHILVATDVASRGLDIKGIDLVVNFDIGRNPDDYVHRIGRTGRAGEAGTAITLSGPLDWKLLENIERYLRQKLIRRILPGLKAKYTGPKKKKKPTAKELALLKKSKGKKSAEKTPAEKAKERLRNKKNKGKPKPKAVTKTSPATEDKGEKDAVVNKDGFSPLRKKPK